MTYRTVYTPPGHFAPEHDDHATEEAATRHALAVSREQNVEVAVINLDSTEGKP